MASSVNQVTLVGRLGADPQLKNINGSNKLCLLSVATSVEYNDRNGSPQSETQWHKVSVWGAKAQPCCQYLHKGDRVCVIGSIRYSDYEQNGVKMKSIEIVAREVVFLTAKTETQSAPPQQQPAAQNGWPQPQQPLQPQAGWGQPAPQPQPQPQPGWGAPMDDVPF